MRFLDGRVSRVVLVCVILPGVFGCSAEATQGDRVIATDSAGVPFYSSSGSGTAEPLNAVLSSEPHLRLGTVMGRDELQFSNVLDAIRLSDGRLAVAESGERRVRVFDPEGSFEQWIGELGDGPAEYASVGGMGVLEGDTIWVYDSRRRRLTLFDPTGGFVRAVDPDRPPDANRPVRTRLLRSGFVVDESTTFDLSGLEAGTESYQDEIILSILDEDGGSPTVVGRVPGALYRISTLQLDNGREAIGFTTGLDRRFTARPFFVVGNSEIYRADPGSFEIRVFSGAGDLKRVIRIARSRRPVTSEIIGSFEERLLRTASDPETMRERLLETTYADSLPHFQRLLADDDNGLWLEEFVGHLGDDPQVDSNAPRRWWRVDSEGLLEGFIQVPDGVRLLRIQGNEVLGVATDELEVPFLVVYRLDQETVEEMFP